jgi:hypothetical protein
MPTQIIGLSRRIWPQTAGCVDLGARVIGIHFSEEGSVHHDSAVDRHLIRSVLCHEKAVAFAIAVMTTHQRDEPSATLDKFGLNSTPTWVVCKRESRQCLDASHAAELGNLYLHHSVTEDRTVEVSISAGETVVLHLEFVHPLLTNIEDDSSIFLGTKTSGIQQVVRLEEGLNKIVCDLTVLQQWNKLFSRSLVGFLHVADQQV